MLFNKSISGPGDWAAVYCDKAAFEPLAREALRAAGISSGEPIEGLEPGTNAVFKIGSHVIKLFAPEGSGFYSPEDYAAELAAYRLCAANGIPAPKIYGRGEIRDRYIFRYIVYEYIRPSRPYMDIFAAPDGERREFARALRSLLQRMNVPADGYDLPHIGQKSREARVKRMASLAPGLINGLCSAPADAGPAVFCHGDITAENLLLGEGYAPRLIDFADSLIAPAIYELTPLIFEALRLDGIMAREFAAGLKADEFIGRLIDSLRLHMFAGNCIRDFFAREGIDPASVGSTDELKIILYNKIYGR